MATFENDEEEMYLKCPFNPLHNRIATRRYSFHLSKCPDGKDAKFTSCPFNDEHRIEIKLMDKHIQQCPDGRSFYRQRIQGGRIQRETGRSFRYGKEKTKESDIGSPVMADNQLIKATDLEKKRDKMEVKEKREDKEENDHLSSGKEENPSMAIPGLHIKLTPDEIAARHVESGKTPSCFSVQALSKSKRKVLNKNLVAMIRNKRHHPKQSLPGSNDANLSTCSSAITEVTSLSRSTSVSSITGQSSCSSAATLSTSIRTLSILAREEDDDCKPLRRPRIIAEADSES